MEAPRCRAAPQPPLGFAGVAGLLVLVWGEKSPHPTHHSSRRHGRTCPWGVGSPARQPCAHAASTGPACSAAAWATGSRHPSAATALPQGRLGRLGRGWRAKPGCSHETLNRCATAGTLCKLTRLKKQPPSHTPRFQSDGASEKNLLGGALGVRAGQLCLDVVFRLCLWSTVQPWSPWL